MATLHRRGSRNTPVHAQPSPPSTSATLPPRHRPPPPDLCAPSPVIPRACHAPRPHHADLPGVRFVRGGFVPGTGERVLESAREKLLEPVRKCGSSSAVVRVERVPLRTLRKVLEVHEEDLHVGASR